MKPIDYRNESWHDVQRRIVGDAHRVYEGYRQHGPCTTRQLAERTGMDILTVRPRTTDLYQAGFVRLADEEAGAPRGREGVYVAATYVEAREAYQAARRRAREDQMELGIDDRR